MTKLLGLLPLMAMMIVGSSGCMETQLAETVSGTPEASHVAIQTSTAGLWSAVTTTESLDLRGYRPGTSQTMRFEFENGMNCECLAQSTGLGDLMVLSLCKEGSDSAGDPGCNTFAETYNLNTMMDANSNPNLKVCDSKTSCALYH